MTTAVRERPTGATAGWVRRWNHPVAVGLAALGSVIFAFFMWTLLTDARWEHMRGLDRDIYYGAVTRLLEGGQWFYPEQVTGRPYEVIVGHVMYPPTTIPLIGLVVVLPWPLWYLIPSAIILAVLLYHRPSPWAWAAIAACLVYPSTSELVVSGNPGLWVVAFCAIGTVWRPAFALIFLKPSLFPFALIGIRSRGWWALVALGSVVSLALLPLTLQWLGVVLNARGQFSGPLYASRDIALMLIPLVAWAGATRGSTEPVANL